jgi:prephenate dehydratase
MVPCATFPELVRKVENPRDAEYGLMAIENSIAGSIMNNYTLLQKSQLRIKGELILSIRQHLMVNRGVRLEDIREVHSHPMALLQCMSFLEKHTRWKLVESQDTAYSARYVRQHRAKHVAAVAGQLAADLFQLEILEQDIQSDKKNFTRFLILGRGDDYEKNNVDKASVYFHTEHHKGSLAAILIRIAASGINLLKLQSVPVPGSEWQYGFHTDLEFSDYSQYLELKGELKKMSLQFREFGVYKKGLTI